ncbi:MAG: RNA methyltransferase [Stellaceae bacterium]
MMGGRFDPSAATHNHRTTHERQLCRICGLAAVRALFERDPDRVERLFFEVGLRREVGPFCRSLAQARKPYREVEAAELARIAGTVLHGGIIAVALERPVLAFNPTAAGEWASDGKPLLILDGIGNPHNLGAIVRTAAFFGLERMVLSDRPEQAQPSDASYRVAEGGLEYLSLYRAPIPAAFDHLRPAYRVVGTALGKNALPAVWGAPRPIALIFGNEESGLGPATLAACDEVVAIPGSGRVQSLNVAAAAAILIYLLTRS